MNLIHHNSFANAHYDKYNKIIRLEFIGQVNTDLAKEAFQSVIDFSHGALIKGTYADTTRISGTISEIYNFYIHEYLVNLVDKGLMCSALITSEGALPSFEISPTANHHNGFEMQVFNDLFTTIEWVTSKVHNLEEAEV